MDTPFWSAILDVTVLLTAALVMGLIFQRLRQSALVAYLLAGLLLGPAVFNVISDGALIQSLSELGVALLLFSIGLEFSFRKLRAIGRVALLGGMLQIGLTVLLVAGVCMALGMSPSVGLAIGVIIAPSSTAAVMRLLEQRAEVDSVHGRAALGILLFQDIAVVPLLIVMGILGGSGSAESVAIALIRTIGLASILIVAFYVLTNFVLPRLLGAAALSRNRDLPILVAVATFLAAAWGAHALQFSPVLGAFVAGMLLAESPFATWIRADAAPFRVIFVTLFFVSIGMIDSLAWLGQQWWMLALAAPAVVIGKAAVITLAARACKVPLRHALAAGFCLAQTGEFSFVLAAFAYGGTEGGGFISETAFQLIVATTIVTLMITPYLVMGASRLSRVLLSLLGIKGPADDDRERADETLRDHVILIGLGPAGRAVFAALSTEVPLAVVDLNPATIAQVREHCTAAIAGDASQEDVFEKLRLVHARALVVTIPEPRASLHIVRMARSVAPDVTIIARARYHAFANELQLAGARIIDEEYVTGDALARHVVEVIRSTPAIDLPGND